jgi:biotin carboxyl carrier protein
VPQVKEGDTVSEGANLMTLSAMKMETAISAPVAGKVAQVTVELNEDVAQGDLLVKIVPSQS